MSKLLNKHIKTILQLQNASALISWDLETLAPVSSHEEWGAVSGHLSGLAHKMTTDAKFYRMLKKARPRTPLAQETVDFWIENYREAKKVPVKLVENLDEANAVCSSAWKECSSFEEIYPHLEKVVNLTKQWADCFEGNPYNSLIECYDPDVSVDYISNVFDPVKDELINLRKSVNVDIKCDYFKHAEPVDYENLWKFAARWLKFSFKKGVTAKTVHPFMQSFGKNDVRVAMNALNPKSSFYGAVHEMGHGIYEQNVADELAWTGFGSPLSTGLHESQSLFCEQFLFKSELFWREAFDEFGGQFLLPGTSLETFLGSLREYDPDNVVRLCATELDYGLHIMLRFDLERALFSGEISVKEMNDRFNDLTMQYFGRYPKDFRHEGMGQDIHWFCGLYGYFPCYLLGAMTASQLWASLKDSPNVETVIKWLNDNVHAHGGRRDFKQTLQALTGDEKPNTKIYVDWLKNEFR